MTGAVLVLLAASSCTRSTDASRDQTPSGKLEKATMNTWDVSQGHVMRQAGPEASVGGYEDVRVPGYDLFWVTISGPADMDNGYAAAVKSGNAEVLTGTAAMRALLPHAPQGAEPLARLSLVFLEKGGEVVTAAESEEERRAGAAAPARAGDTVTYWYRNYGISSSELRRSTVNLKTLAVDSAPVAPLPAGAADEVDQAAGMLGNPNPNVQRGAIRLLTAACTPKAAAALAHAAETHARPETRSMAVEATPACRGDGTTQALIRIMEKDSVSDVRWRAAQALGSIGDVAARTALETAAASSDPHLARAAQQALIKLPKQ